MKIKKLGVLAAVLMAGSLISTPAQTTLSKQSSPFGKTEKFAAVSKNKEENAGKTEVSNTADETKEVAAKAAQNSSSSCESCRWFEPTVASFSMRYRTTTDAANVRTLNQNQQRIVLGGKLKFDKEGKYTINVQASSGYYFNWAYADTGWGNTTNDAIHKAAPGLARFVTPEIAPGVIASTVNSYIAAHYPNATPAQLDQIRPVVTAQLTPIVTQQVYNGLVNQFSTTTTRTKGWNLFIRQLYVQAKPVKGLEFQYGSLPISRGVNSEATSYDDDGYVMGGRVTIKRPKELFFDEVGVTYAYLGDIFTPNFFRRTERVKQSNYHQFLVRKKLLKGKVDVSADYTFQDGTDTMREGVVVDVKASKVVDTLRFESYQRIGDNVVWGKTFKAGNGFYASAEKTFAKRLTLNGGIADIDRNYTVYGEYNTKGLDYYGFGLNGDQTGVGRRFVGRASYKITDDLTVSTLYSHAFANESQDARYYWNKTHFNVALTYDVLKGVKRLGWFK